MGNTKGILKKRMLTMRTVAFFISLVVFTFLLYVGKITETTFYNLFTSSLFIIGLDVAKTGIDTWREGWGKNKPKKEKEE